MEASAGSTIEHCLRERFPRGRIVVSSADGIHFRLEVTDASFVGMGTLARHRLVQQLIAPFMTSGLVHAIEVHPRTPDEERTA